MRMSQKTLMKLRTLSPYILMSLLYQWKRSYYSWKKVPQSCPFLYDPMDWSLPDSPVYGILQERMLEWVAILFSSRSSQPGNWTQISCIVGGFFTIWATKEAWWEHTLGKQKGWLYLAEAKDKMNEKREGERVRRQMRVRTSERDMLGRTIYVFTEGEIRVWFLKPDMDFTKGDQPGVILKINPSQWTHLQWCAGKLILWKRKRNTNLWRFPISVI